MHLHAPYHRAISFVLAALSVLSIVHAAPFLAPRQDITTLSEAQISPFKPYTYFASTGYCNPATTFPSWSCGANCQANPSFKPVASGGDGVDTQFWFVGYNPASDGVIVSHQGTDASKIVPALIDGDFILKTLDPTLFAGISSSVMVHSGFADEQASTAPKILSAVQKAMSENGATQVTMVGHSLGAALSLLDSVYLPLHLPSGTKFKTITYGLPRVGNQAFANYVDEHANLRHINNKEDPVPILPPEIFGYVHPSGEIHIEDSGAWDECPGQDNDSKLCSTGDVSLVHFNLNDHDGPYDGVTMGC